jgi:hypothetical protein
LTTTPTPVGTLPEPLPDALRNATWGPYYSGLSDTQIAQNSNLTRQQLDIRASLQDEAHTLISWLRRRFPNVIGLTWLDQKAGTMDVASTDPEAVRLDPELSAYAHRSYVTVLPANWSERRIDATWDCIQARLGEVHPEAQVRLKKAAPEFWIEAADNQAGHAVLENPVLANEVADSNGVLVTRLHPFEQQRSDG